MGGGEVENIPPVPVQDTLFKPTVIGQHRIVNEPGFIIENANLNVQTGTSQCRRTTYATRRRVNDRDNDASDASIDQGLATRWGATVVIARLQCDDRSPAMGVLPSGGECLRFGMRPTLAFVVTFTNEVLISIKNYTANGWVGTGRPKPEC